MKLHLVDGTFELFRCFHATPRYRAADGREIGAVRGLAQTLIRLVRKEGATHVAVAFDRLVPPSRDPDRAEDLIAEPDADALEPPAELRGDFDTGGTDEIPHDLEFLGDVGSGHRGCLDEQGLCEERARAWRPGSAWLVRGWRGYKLLVEEHSRGPGHHEHKRK